MRLLWCGAVCAVALAAQGTEPPAHKDLAGSWLGTLKIGPTHLRLAFEIEREGDGYRATLTSVDQGNAKIPCADVTLQNEACEIRVPSIGGKLSGSWTEAGEIEGKWTQGGARIPIVLTRVKSLPVARRPQEPQGPLPYRWLEVRYEQPQGGFSLAGTLSEPEGEGPFPAVLLITGSGAQDRDEALAGHRPFLILADALTRRGLAVLRVDDRGIGGSGGGDTDPTTEELVDDVLAGVAFLKSRPEICSDQIALVGHSEGGLIAPLAAVRSPDVAAIVLLAGPGTTGEQILYTQSAEIMAAGGASQELIDANRAVQEKMFAELKQQLDEDDREHVERVLQELLAEEPAVEVLLEGTEIDRQEWMERQLAACCSRWFRFFLFHDPVPVLEQVHCPVLALIGERDLQVSPKVNLPLIRDALARGKNSHATVQELPELNHLFQTSKTGAISEYGQIEETFAPAALTLVGDWLYARFKCRLSE
jgi:pimeloyl-ACP methyl ester carboxylesterase